MEIAVYQRLDMLPVANRARCERSSAGSGRTAALFAPLPAALPTPIGKTDEAMFDRMCDINLKAITPDNVETPTNEDIWNSGDFDVRLIHAGRPVV